MQMKFCANGWGVSVVSGKYRMFAPLSEAVLAEIIQLTVPVSASAGHLPPRVTWLAVSFR